MTDGCNCKRNTYREPRRSGGNNFSYGYQGNTKSKKSNKPSEQYKITVHTPETEKIPPETPKAPPQQPPGTPSVFSEEAHVKNRYSNTSGEQKVILDANNQVQQTLDLEKGNLHGFYSMTSFTMNNNVKSSLSLSSIAQDFIGAFDRLNANKNGDSANTVSEAEFLAVMEECARETNEAGTDGADYRGYAAHFDNNKADLQKLFKAIAGNDGLITEDEYVNFWNEVMSNGEKQVDEKSNKELTVVSGETFNNVVNKRLEALSEKANFHQVEEATKTEELKEAKNDKNIKALLDARKIGDTDSLVQNIAYNKNGVMFLTLADGTEIQLVNQKARINISQEDDGRICLSDGNGQSTKGIIIIPGKNSKLKFKDCKNIVMWDKDNNNSTDLVLDGSIKKSCFIWGSGNDSFDKSLLSENSKYRVIKDISNTNIQLESADDFVAIFEQNSKNSNSVNLYSAKSKNLKSKIKNGKVDIDKDILKAAKKEENSAERAEKAKKHKS